MALKEQDIDWEANEIYILHIVTLEKDKDNKMVPVVVEHLKTDNSNRVLPLREYEIVLLKKVIEINKIYGFSDQGFIFIDKEGRSTPSAIDNHIRKCCKATNIEVKSAHDIRRTVVSEMHMNGIPIELIRDFMEHSEISTT